MVPVNGASGSADSSGGIENSRRVSSFRTRPATFENAENPKGGGHSERFVFTDNCFR